MPTSFINDPEHWRQRANEMRTFANSAKDPRSKAAMLQIAAEYDGLQRWRKNEAEAIPSAQREGGRFRFIPLRPDRCGRALLESGGARLVCVHGFSQLCAHGPRDRATPEPCPRASFYRRCRLHAGLGRRSERLYSGTRLLGSYCSSPQITPRNRVIPDTADSFHVSGFIFEQRRAAHPTEKDRRPGATGGSTEPTGAPSPDERSKSAPHAAESAAPSLNRMQISEGECRSLVNPRAKVSALSLVGFVHEIE
jgi:hypothetical protein